MFQLAARNTIVQRMMATAVQTPVKVPKTAFKRTVTVKTAKADSTEKAVAAPIPPEIVDAAPPGTVSTMNAQKAPSSFPKTTSSSTPSSLSTWKNFDDTPSNVESNDWSTSFAGLGVKPFSDRAIEVLTDPLKAEDIEITPDGLLFLPEIKYRRILNRAFGPGGWGLAPRSKTEIAARTVTREYGLICMGRLVGVARGEQDYFNPDGVATAIEGCKSNAMMRCCKDLGIASELWDPVFINAFKKKHCEQKYNEKKRKYLWKRKDRDW